MSPQRAFLLRRGLIAGCALTAVVLLAIFYSTVSGAVERASRQRFSVAEGGGALTQSAAVVERATRPVAVPARATRPVALFARSGN